MKKLIFILIVAFVLIGSGCGTSTTQPSTPPTPSLRIGDECIINRFEDKTRCELMTALSVNEDEYDEIFTSMEADDMIGLATMIIEGRAFLVDNCTKAKLVDTDVFMRRVRILEGEMAGEAGWLPMEWITIIE